MARSISIVVLLVATMAVSAMALKGEIRGTSLPSAQTFPKFSWLGTSWSWKAGWYCNYDPVTGLCTYDNNWGFWWPVKPFLTPVYYGPVSDTQTTYALCQGITAKAIASSGGCDCPDTDGDGVFGVGSSNPIRLTGTLANPTILPCGTLAVPAAQCNAWQCTCVDADDTASAWAYCV